MTLIELEDRMDYLESLIMHLIKVHVMCGMNVGHDIERIKALQKIAGDLLGVKNGECG